MTTPAISSKPTPKSLTPSCPTKRSRPLPEPWRARYPRVRSTSSRRTAADARWRDRAKRQRMKIENAVPYIGALVTGLDVKRMTNSEWQTLYQTWLDRHVLIVRGQELSKADFLAHSRRFGGLKTP